MKKERDNDTLFRLYNETKDVIIRNEIYEKNENLIYHFLNHLQAMENYEDILQEGRIGLLHAIENYDINSNVQFSTFAAHYIKGYAKRCPSSYCSLYMQNNLKWKYKKYMSLKQNMQNMTEQELSKKTGLNEKDIKYFNQMGNFLSLIPLDSPIECTDDAVNMIEIVPDESTNIERDYLIHDINKQVLDVIYETFYEFSEEQYKILFYRFGINDYPKLKEKDIVNILNIDPKLVRNTMAVYVRRQRDFKRNIRRRFSIPFNVKDIDVTNIIYDR